MRREAPPSPQRHCEVRSNPRQDEPPCKSALLAGDCRAIARNDVMVNLLFLFMNQAVNFFWTILCFIPVIGFWYAEGLTAWFYILTGISIISLLVPSRLLQLSNNPKFYEGIGIKFIRKFVQDGDIARRIIKKSNPQYRVIKNKENALKYQSTIVMYERYHFLCFVFFLLTAGFAFYTGKYQFGLLVILADVVYNICPILLQQYNRARVGVISRYKHLH